MKGEWVKRGSSTAPVVVFVHGILSSGQSCWRHVSGAYWPEIVAQDLQMSDLGVYVFTYRTGFFSGSYRLADAVDALKEHLALDGINGSTGIVFVCHSMGGIVVRRYLVSRATELIERHARIALFLVASPSLGADYADWLKPLAKVLGHSQGDALRFARSNIWLADLDRDFFNLKEQGRLDIIGKELIEDQFIAARWLWRKQVVEAFSGARYFGEPYKVPGSDHFSISKIESEQAIQHRQLRRFIAEWREAGAGAAISSNCVVQAHVDTSEQSDGWSNGVNLWLSYREQFATRADRLDWWAAPIPLQGKAVGEFSMPVHELLENWMNSIAEQHCLLLGDPGAGKTGLLIWVASKLATSEQVIPLWISAKQLQALSVIDLEALLTRCEPRPPVSTAEGFNGYNVVLLLDGLDELVGAAQGGETKAGYLLQQTLGCLPKAWRVIASCRTPAFEALSGTVMEALPRSHDAMMAGDQYDAAISRALGVEGVSTTRIEVARVNAQAAIEYLEHNSLPPATVEGLFADEKWRQLLTSPFLLRLARAALPALVESGSPSVDRLYKAYARACLFREKNDISESEIKEILDDLTQFANFLDKDRILVSPGLPLRADLIRSKAGTYDFTHYSLWEFFFACHLCREISDRSANTLSRVDLIAGYNINRMLIPMLLRKLPLTKLEHDSVPRLITPREYLDFLSATNWRRAVGYGFHPARTGKDTTVRASTFKFGYDEAVSVRDDRQHGNGVSSVACAVSWYDAVAYCLYKHARLPTKIELQSLRPVGNKLLWSSQWFDETSSLIAVYDMASGEVQGLNPDVRLSRTSLSVIDC